MWSELESPQPSSSSTGCRFIVETRPFTDFDDPAYKRWFGEHGMRTVHPKRRVDRGLDDPLPPPPNPVGELGYVAVAPKMRRVVRIMLIKF